MTTRPPLHFNDVFATAVDAHPDREAFVEGDRRTTYTTWAEHSTALAAAWAEQGVGPGDVVAITLPSSTDFAIAYVAAVRLGAVATAINTRCGPREVESILEACRPSVVVTGPGSPPLTDLGTCFDEHDVARALQAGRDIPAHDAEATDPMCIVWTSGTTGMPKGAWFDHRANASLAEMSGVLSEPGDRRVLPIPFAHAGFMTRVWDQVAHGITSVIPIGAWSAEAMLRTMADERITVGQGVPTQWAQLVRLPEVASTDLSALRICATGAAPVAPELAAAMVDRLGCPVVVRYACTEIPILAGTAPSDPADVLLRTVGRPAAGVQIELRHQDGSPTPRGETGIVHARSSGSMRGYWGRRDFDPDRADGWIPLGDLARFDDDGNLVLCGRTTEMYIRGGYNVYPLEVQHAIQEHPHVAEAAVIGVDAPVIGQIGVAFVVAAPNRTPPSRDEVRAWVRTRLADYKSPDEIVTVDTLPRNAMGKIDLVQLRQLAADVSSRAHVKGR